MLSDGLRAPEIRGSVVGERGGEEGKRRGIGEGEDVGRRGV